MNADIVDRQNSDHVEGAVKIFNGSRSILLNLRALDAGNGEVILLDVEAVGSVRRACYAAADAKKAKKGLA